MMPSKGLVPQPPEFHAADAPLLICLATAVNDATVSGPHAPLRVVTTITSAAPHLSANYVEVQLLVALLQLHCAALIVADTVEHQKDETDNLLTKLHEVQSYLSMVENVLPDAVFVIIRNVLQRLLEWGKESSETAHQSMMTSVLALMRELAEVCVRVETAIMQSTNSLEVRCEHLTIHFRNVFPYCE